MENNEITLRAVSPVITKREGDNNPALATTYCADPTSVVYNGRLYVYATNDHQMYKNLKPTEEVNYGYINTLVILSTSDMANWTYHGEVEVTKAAKWAKNSWAPSMVSRVEEDGLTHFYLYFADGGNGIGVLTSTSPTGPWKDPIGKQLVSRSSKGLGKCEWLFDPGACINDKGEGYISFGGGPGSDNCKIAKLGKDMVSLEGDIVALPKCLQHFEANELNFVNGTYYLSYCSNWVDQPIANMMYGTSKTPLIADSWEWKGSFFKNTGDFGLGGGNNHTHIEYFNGKYYLIYQAHDLHSMLGVKGDCRNINIDEVIFDEENQVIKAVKGTRLGVPQTASVNPFELNEASNVATGSGYGYKSENGKITVVAETKNGIGAWTMVKKVDFTRKPETMKLSAKGKGIVKVLKDTYDISSEAVAEFTFDSVESVEQSCKLNVTPEGSCNLFFVFTNGLEFENWKFE